MITYTETDVKRKISKYKTRYRLHFNKGIINASPASLATAKQNMSTLRVMEAMLAKLQGHEYPNPIVPDDLETVFLFADPHLAWEYIGTEILVYFQPLPKNANLKYRATQQAILTNFVNTGLGYFDGTAFRCAGIDQHGYVRLTLTNQGVARLIETIEKLAP